MKAGNWKPAKEKELKMRIEKLALKLVWITNNVKAWGPRRAGTVLKGYWISRTKIMKTRHKMAVRSLIATRKKIYRLQAELKAL